MKYLSAMYENRLIRYCLIMIIIYYGLHNVFRSLDSFYGVGDIRNYHKFYASQTYDKTHFLLIGLMTLIGFEETLTILCFMFIPICFYAYFRDINKTLLAVFFSQYMLYVATGVYSQIMNFGFFLLYISKTKYKSLWYVLGVLSHPTFSLSFFVYELSQKNIKKILLTGLVCAMVYLSFQTDYREYSIVNKGITASSYKEPSHMETFLMINPFMLIPTLNLTYLMFFIYGLLGHNGRMAMYFIPFLVKHYNWKNKNIMLLTGGIFMFLSIIAPFYRFINP